MTTTNSTNFYTDNPTMDRWGPLQFKEVHEVGESIEMIYIQKSTFSRSGGLPPYHDERAVKIIYSCIDGKWNKSDPIFGKIVAP